ncbi:MAG: TIGR03643 family protein [Sphingobacteriales bacterium]|nr:MAG: TIGR03643 family protein [Sphingobacteriales bacterium]TAF78779.1 MAG: TIGR03643 family protein [Sphingobacteriales bacterium]
MNKIIKQFNEKEIDRIIEMAWEDRTPFEAIKYQFNLNEANVIALMRHKLKPSSWRLWRERVHQTSLKHLKKRSLQVNRFKCNLQRSISFNKISKR